MAPVTAGYFIHHSSGKYLSHDTCIHLKPPATSRRVISISFTESAASSPDCLEHLIAMTSDPGDLFKSPKSVDGTDAEAGKKESIFRRPSATNASTPVAESWITLCAQAAVEKDPKRLLELVSEINRQLDARKKRLTSYGSEGGNRNANDVYPRS
jgi:hypothetical protein